MMMSWGILGISSHVSTEKTHYYYSLLESTYSLDTLDNNLRYPKTRIGVP